MDRPGRILVVDNLEEWCKALVETLLYSGFHADSSSTVTEALERLNQSFYHILVIDIRMNETDQNNIDGIDLLRELDKRGLSEATKVIMLSAYGTIEQMRTAFREYKVADFLSKYGFTKQIFLESVRQVFSRNVNINLALDIHWQLKSKSEQVVLSLEVDGTRIKRGTPLQNQVAAELEDLLCRLFYQAKSIQIQPLTSGRSGTGVMRIQPFYSAKGIGYEVIVKFGDCSKIEEEYNNFKEYVQPFLGGGRNTTILDVRRTPQLGGIIYSLLGSNNDRLVDFGEFYRHGDLSQIKGALNRLFLDTCGAWYANRGHLQPLDLTADYQRLFGYTAKQLEQVLSKQHKSVQVKQKLYFKSLNSERPFTNPLLATAELSLIRSTYLCITHGDFNPHNLLVDSTGHVWMIDFQETGQGHILRDIAILDSVIRFQLLTAEEATLKECLQMEEALCSIEHFSQVQQLATKFSTPNQALSKAYATVVHLRTLARRLVDQNPNDDIGEYYIALLYNAMNTLRFSSLSSGQREHALLCASLLADRLGLGK
ncbi:MAG: response regulator [Ktedonobacteraceae bacterium]